MLICELDKGLKRQHNIASNRVNTIIPSEIEWLLKGTIWDKNENLEIKTIVIIALET